MFNKIALFPFLDTTVKMVQAKCSCSNNEEGVCENRTLVSTQGSSVEATVYVRGCSRVISDDVLHDLHGKSLPPPLIERLKQQGPKIFHCFESCQIRVNDNL